MQTVSSPSSPVQKEAQGCITVGSAVAVRFPAGEMRTFTITSNPRAVAPDKGIISDRSPLGAALLGKRVGETATFVVGTKNSLVEITAVKAKQVTYVEY